MKNKSELVAEFRNLAKNDPGKLAEIGALIADAVTRAEADRKRAREEARLKAERDAVAKRNASILRTGKLWDERDAELREQEAERMLHPEREMDPACKILSAVGQKANQGPGTGQ